MNKTENDIKKSITNNMVTIEQCTKLKLDLFAKQLDLIKEIINIDNTIQRAELNIKCLQEVVK